MKKFLLVFFSFAFVLSAWAQERVVTGKVTSVEDGSPFPGVNVVVKGTTNGTATDAEGRFSITVSGPTTLTFSFIGLKSSEVAVGDRTVVDVQMEPEVTQLSEVVVTALNIPMDARVLGYSTQSINNDKLTMTRSNNIGDGITGKIAGVQVRSQAGSKLGFAGDASIRIRGASGLNDKAPLFVLDGVPLTSLADVNPDDVETTTVLKGGASTALYGQRGDAGVIIMTSKKARKGQGLGIDVNHTTFADNVWIVPREQNSYAGGAFPELVRYTYQPGQPTEWQPLDGKYYPDYTDDGSWGPKMNGQEYIPWYSWIPGTKYTGKTASLTPQPNNIRDFFRTGVNNITNVAVSKADENFSVRASYTNQSQTGITPNTWQNKHTFSTQVSYNLSKLITIGSNINYNTQHVHGQFDDGYANQTSGSFFSWFHRDLDMNILNELAEVKSPKGRFVSWNHFNPTSYLSQLDGGDGFYRGYYWWGHKTYVDAIDYNTFHNRLNGDVNIKLNIHKNFFITGAYQKNDYSYTDDNRRPTILPNSFQTELRPTTQSQWDYFRTGSQISSENNLNFLANFSNKYLNDKLSITVMGGGNIRRDKNVTLYGETNQGLVVPDLFTLSNSSIQPFITTSSRSRKEVRSFYGQANFGWGDIVSLNVTGRNDWNSALPKTKNSYFYPSASLSFIFSELTQTAVPVLSYGKLRASFAQTGTDVDAYGIALAYGLGAAQWNSNSVMGVPDTYPSPTIGPALSNQYEFGTDLKFFGNKLGLSVTYYNRDKTKEIIPITTPSESGFGNLLINGGKVNSHGIEIELSATPIQTEKFRWDININAAHQVSKIIRLIPGLDSQVQTNAGGVSDAFGVATVYNTVGKKWGQLRGRGITKAADGTPVLDGAGLYTYTPNTDLGSVMPDFTGGTQNTFSYGNFQLSANIAFQKGGKFFSLSDYWGTFSGLTQRTARLNDRGVSERDPVADGGGVHVKGVDEGGNPVDTYVEGKVYWQQFGNTSFAENSILDLSYVKLAEMSLGYRIPVKKLGGIGNVLRTAMISIQGRNLAMLWSKTKDYDPASIAGVYGENGQLLATRSIGFNLKLGL